MKLSLNDDDDFVGPLIGCIIPTLILMGLIAYLFIRLE